MCPTLLLKANIVTLCLQTKAAAHVHVANNDDDGVAEAIERFIL